MGSDRFACLRYSLSDQNFSNSIHRPLRGANLGDYASFSAALLLNTNLENAEGLTQRMLSGSSAFAEGVVLPEFDPPLLCNTVLPPHIKEIDPNRDCGRMPQALLDYWNRWSGINPDHTPITLEETTSIVEESRQRKWDE